MLGGKLNLRHLLFRELKSLGVNDGKGVLERELFSVEQRRNGFRLSKPVDPGHVLMIE